ncbi:MvaI/BcnI family restriction endonuclease [Erythrobacter sp. EC-HK427]|uniref:MvaI/BcnI family restriction endonuclease n=1 Tax=Erythrobacter sp. EC-HK427 TaxID=2038396 RepID=UPI001256CCE5|nr:MvaI/BcnI family restriction endonuclease [Erythrobacter sp. EC-HK427]VVS96139.1 conserved hypothetical protein [Erythrobacter sp. EC-HK427]
MQFEHSPPSVEMLGALLSAHGVGEALIKPLTRNHNDKNQIYSGAEFAPLYPMFDMDFSLRGASTSAKKGGTSKGKAIPEAVFRDFVWLDATGSEVPARGVRMIVYAQYPETRLSGFSTVGNTMPESLSVGFTKANPDTPRYLVMGRRGSGSVVAAIVLDPPQAFRDQVKALPNASGSRVWKHLVIGTPARDRLLPLLVAAAGRPMPGCRLDASGATLPFNGTQVCGYTLEHALGIVPNSAKDGDFEGIELKTHTQRKVTLFTPEPDMGAYAEDFASFMQTWGYPDASGNLRLTGIHRVGIRCEKSGLTLQVINHERGRSLAASADSDVHLGLIDDQGRLAAGWSLERMLNCWSAKHNEAVYVPATKTDCTDPRLTGTGHRYLVEFARQIMWCRETSAERLFEALYNGTLFLDPAPKYCPDNPGLNKRRSQWRVNDIAAAARDLYKDVRKITLDPQRTAE